MFMLFFPCLILFSLFPSCISCIFCYMLLPEHNFRLLQGRKGGLNVSPLRVVVSGREYTHILGCGLYIPAESWLPLALRREC